MTPIPLSPFPPSHCACSPSRCARPLSRQNSFCTRAARPSLLPSAHARPGPAPGRSINTAARSPSFSFRGGGRRLQKVSGARHGLTFISLFFFSILFFFLISCLFPILLAVPYGAGDLHEGCGGRRCSQPAPGPPRPTCAERPEGRGIPRGGGQRRLSPPSLPSHRFVPDARAGVAQFAPPLKSSMFMEHCFGRQ